MGMLKEIPPADTEAHSVHTETRSFPTAELEAQLGQQVFIGLVPLKQQLGGILGLRNQRRNLANDRPKPRRLRFLAMGQSCIAGHDRLDSTSRGGWS